MAETNIFIIVKREPPMYLYPSQKVTYPFSKGYISFNQVTCTQLITLPLNKAYK